MFDMGFAPQIEAILKSIPGTHQTLLFSATMPQDIVGIAVAHMQLPVRIEVAPQGAPADNITQELFIVKREDKKPLLLKLLASYTGTVLLFTRTKHGAQMLTRFLRSHDIPAAEIHSNRSQAQRKAALDGFKSGRYRVLAATDIAARGIDVDTIELIVNFDLPDETENYVHRIGRTARAGKKGHAISFATSDQKRNVRMIEKLIRFEIQISQHPEIIAQEFDRYSEAPKKKPSFRKKQSRYRRR